jgi:alkanesulfonate monooxygenase SsuD/methylene tetrahydromethanopterin reductase-like flavin-dependent oxidoreductase (luciferase family)
LGMTAVNDNPGSRQVSVFVLLSAPYWTPMEKAHAMQMLTRSIYGSPETVHAGIEALIAEAGADELMIVSDVYEHKARLRSFELIAESVR